MLNLYINDNEYQQHSEAIHLLADQYHINEPFVREVYEKILKDLSHKAKFRKYLIVLVARQVKEFLRK